MMRYRVLALALLVAACGADGEPVAPKVAQDAGLAVSVTGRADMGVSGGW